MRVRIATCAVVLVAACGGGPGRPAGVGGTGPDAPYDLADESDLEARRTEADALALDDPARPALRDALAAAYAERLALDLELGRGGPAREQLIALASLWRPPELARGVARPALARHRDVVAQARVAFARSGDEIGAAIALAALGWIEPDDPRHAADLDELVRYGDAMAPAAADRARPITVLTEVAHAFPTEPVVDGLVDRLRRRRAAALQAPPEPRALAGVARTAARIVGALAWADRLAEAPAAIARLEGLGADPALADRLRAALAPGGGAATVHAALAAVLLEGDDGGEPHGALAVAEAALARFPRDAGLHRRAAEAALALGLGALAVRHDEAALADRLAPPEAIDELAALYLERISALGQADRARAAAAVLDRFEALAARAEAEGHRLAPDLAEAWATFGRVLVSLGELDAGARYLEASVARRPGRMALETLGTVALQRGRPADAVVRFERALRLAVVAIDDRYERAKLYRPYGEAQAAAGRPDRARAAFEAGLDEWNRLAGELDLTAPFVAESLVERAKLLARLGAPGAARTAFGAAIDVERGDGAILADVVGFLVLEGDLGAAVDAYLTALAGRGVPETIKVYMSLWIVGEAARQGVEAPARAREHLLGRRGHLWADDLARLATGRATYAALRPRATTRGRRAELAYYAAVLGDARRDPPRARRLLAQVIETDMVLYFEYDLARRRLAR